MIPQSAACPTRLRSLSMGVFSAISSMFSCMATEPTASVQVDLAAEKNPVSPMLHGIFMEEISHAFDGGIYGELIMNRSFEEGVLPPGMNLVKQPDGRQKMELISLPPGVPKEKWPMPWPWGNYCFWDEARATIAWSLENRAGATGEMRLTSANPMNHASSRSMALHVNALAPGSSTALINAGYWGISVREGVSYDLKFFLRPGTFKGKVTAILESADGKPLGRHSFDAVLPGNDWKKFTAKIAATGTDPKARLALAFEGKGDLQVDWVSLFPPTFRNQPNGLRPDLAQYLADLKPSFIRYPGGCYVEGLSWESAPDWRTMVCPPEERPGQWGYWGYRSTDGFGYHEFLEFCEQLGAEPLYVSFCGMTVHPENNMPLDQIQPVIQRTLDAIEYANGPMTSKWGAVRAKMGHPKPFGLKYIEIGNEHPPAIYGDYYVKFREAIKAKYPEMTVIMSMFWSGLNPPAIERAGDANIDMVDEHAYREASWIRQNFEYFDHYPRKNWSIYVGEYASHHGKGDWYGAMGDSLYLMMCERNGDLVKMASYAPLFVNINKSDWGINLIEFDSARSFAHASHQVQKVFAENRPDVNLATKLDVLPKVDPASPRLRGNIGVGSWNTQTEFKDIVVTAADGKVLASDALKSLDGWKPSGGEWSVKDGVARQNLPHGAPAKLILDGASLTTGTISLKARRTGGSEGFLVFFNVRDDETFSFANIGGFGNTHTTVEGRGQNPDGTLRAGPGSPGAMENDRWYEVTLKIGVDQVDVFIDGKKSADAKVETVPSVFTNAGYDRKHQCIVLKATNYHDQPVSTTVNLANAKLLANSAKHIVISSPDPYIDNDFEQPNRIVPTERALPIQPGGFQVTLPPHSVSVLRIPAAKP